MKQDIRKNQELEKAIAHALRLAQRTERPHSVIEYDNKTGYFIEEWYNWQVESYPTTYLLTVEYEDAEYLSDDDEDEYSFEQKASEIRANRHRYIKYDVVELNGREYHWGVALNLMDDEIREQLYDELAPCCTNEEFFETYLIRHFEKYGKEFIIN